jgi:hypothetical protein
MEPTDDPEDFSDFVADIEHDNALRISAARILGPTLTSVRDVLLAVVAQVGSDLQECARVVRCVVNSKRRAGRVDLAASASAEDWRVGAYLAVEALLAAPLDPPPCTPSHAQPSSLLMVSALPKESASQWLCSGFARFGSFLALLQIPANVSSIQLVVTKVLQDGCVAGGSQWVGRYGGSAQDVVWLEQSSTVSVTLARLVFDLVQLAATGSDVATCAEAFSAIRHVCLSSRIDHGINWDALLGAGLGGSVNDWLVVLLAATERLGQHSSTVHRRKAAAAAAAALRWVTEATTSPFVSPQLYEPCGSLSTATAAPVRPLCRC